MPNRHVTSYIWQRGFRYTGVSACAVIAGYLMQAPYVNLDDFVALLIPITCSAFFFICYTNTFYSKESDDIQSAFEKEAVWIFPFIEVPILIAIVLFLALRGTFSVKLLISLGVYSILYFSYGVLLTKYNPSGPLPLVRHQLVWPVILSIALGLYFGLSFSVMKVSFLPLLSVGLLLCIYLVSGFRSSLWVFTRRTLLTGLAVTIITVLAQALPINLPPTLTAAFFTMLFCVAASAYLAVFEAWFITAHVAADVETDAEVLKIPEENRRSTKYGTATLLALILSVWLVPFFFIYSGYGTWFLVLFLFHAFCSYIFWSYFGKGNYLRTLPWQGIKVGVGMAFLGILVAVTFAKEQFPFSAMTGFASVEGLAMAVLAGGFPISRLLGEVGRIKGKKNALFVKILLNRVNGLRLLCLLCLMMCFIIYGLLHSSFKGDLVPRAELAYDAYWLCVVLSALISVLIRTKLLPQMTFLINSALGILISIRIFTSAVIAVVVVWPATSKGSPFLAAMLTASPFFFAACGGFALNDFFDASKDLINKPYRAIPTGRLRPSSVFVVGLIFLILAIVMALLISNSKLQIGLYALSIGGVAVYNLFVKYLTPSKNILTAAISTLPVLYVVVAFGYPKIYLLVPIATCIFLLAREWLMDIKDVPGDLSSGIRTLPVILGVQRTEIASFACLLASSIILAPLAAITLSVSTAILVILIGVTVSLISLLWRYAPIKYRRGVVLALWIPMAFGVLILIV